MPSPIQQVSNVVELLDAIFRSLDRTSNTSNAVVCKQWSDVALSVLWEKVDDENVARLFNILAPLKFRDYHHDFARSLEYEDWQRFDRYRFRVKRLSFKSSTDSSLEESVIPEIAQSRSDLVIFPNLHTLEWLSQYPRLSMTFIHENIKQFSIQFSERGLLRNFAERMPHLTDFICQATNVIEADIVDLVTRSSQLKVLGLSPGNFTARVAEVAAYHTNPEAICLACKKNISQTKGEDFNPQLKEGAYPLLSKFETSMDFHTVSTFVLSLPVPMNLKELHILSPIVKESPVDVAHIVNTIAIHCPHLRSLVLTRFKTEPDDNPSAFVYHESERVSLDNLRSLFRLRSLVHFEISHRLPLLLQPSDIEEIAASMPNIETLILNSEPHKLKTSELTLHSLFPFALRCPKLRTLGLFMNATLDEDQYVLGFPFKHPVLCELSCLSVGYSSIENKVRAAWLLSSICPKLCTIKIGTTHGVTRVRRENWEATMELFWVLAKVRKEEKELARQSIKD